ncbi:hypothetical protein AAMO2058_000904600 [Amorphochlora amoebiformis]
MRIDLQKSGRPLFNFLFDKSSHVNFRIGNTVGNTRKMSRIRVAVYLYTLFGSLLVATRYIWPNEYSLGITEAEILKDFEDVKTTWDLTPEEKPERNKDDPYHRNLRRQIRQQSNSLRDDMYDFMSKMDKAYTDSLLDPQSPPNPNSNPNYPNLNYADPKPRPQRFHNSPNPPKASWVSNVIIPGVNTEPKPHPPREAGKLSHGTPPSLQITSRFAPRPPKRKEEPSFGWMEREVIREVQGPERDAIYEGGMQYTQGETVVANVSYTFGRHVWGMKCLSHLNGDTRFGVALKGYIPILRLGEDGRGCCVGVDRMRSYAVSSVVPEDEFCEEFTQNATMNVHRIKEGSIILMLLDCTKGHLTVMGENGTIIHSFNDIPKFKPTFPAYSAPLDHSFQLGTQFHGIEADTIFHDLLPPARERNNLKYRQEHKGDIPTGQPLSDLWSLHTSQMFTKPPTATQTQTTAPCKSLTSGVGELNALATLVGGEGGRTMKRMKANMSSLWFLEELSALRLLREMRSERFSTAKRHILYHRGKGIHGALKNASKRAQLRLSEAPRSWLLPMETVEDLKWAYRLELQEKHTTGQMYNRNPSDPLKWTEEVWEGVSVPSRNWPPSLWEYVERCYYECRSPFEWISVKNDLITIIKGAISSNNLYRYRWEWFPLILVFSKQRRRKILIDVGQEVAKMESKGSRRLTFQASQLHDIRRNQTLHKTVRDRVISRLQGSIYQSSDHVPPSLSSPLTNPDKRDVMASFLTPHTRNPNTTYEEYQVPAGSVVKTTNSDDDQFAGFRSGGILTPFGNVNLSRGWYTFEDHVRRIKRGRLVKKLRDRQRFGSLKLSLLN